MRLFIAILIGKLIAALSRTLKIGGGSAAPGLFALKVYPELVEVLSKKIPKNAVITGTNGKTTTARILAHLAKEAGIKVIRNTTGSNLERGIASSLLEGINVFHLRGGIDSHLGIWELDEAAFNTVTPKIKPDIIVFLNVFRDQLDRYGEVDSVIKNWCNTLKTQSANKRAQTIILVNGDDVNTAKLKGCFKGKVETFGVEGYKIVGESLQHKVHPHSLDFEAKNVVTSGLDGSTFNLMSKIQIRLPIPGIYHIYDAVAAIAAASHLNLPLPKLLKSLKNFQPAFGRVEKLPFGYIFLIKNPAGATQVFETVAPQIKPQDRLLIALNDNLADGRDVSWIWDVNFELLQNSSRAKPRQRRAKSRDLSLYVSGTRAYDLAVRLKYAGFEPLSIEIEPNLKKALREARDGLKANLFIFPTYTAMLQLQKILAKQGIKQHYWQAE